MFSYYLHIVTQTRALETSTAHLYIYFLSFEMSAQTLVVVAAIIIFAYYFVRCVYVFLFARENSRAPHNYVQRIFNNQHIHAFHGELSIYTCTFTLSPRSMRPCSMLSMLSIISCTKAKLIFPFRFRNRIVNTIQYISEFCIGLAAYIFSKISCFSFSFCS